MGLPRKKADVTTLQIEPKTALMAQALVRVSKLSGQRQDAIAAQILDILQDQSDPASKRFQALVELKYTRGLKPEETEELNRLEAGFDKSDEAFYRPILERVGRLADL